MLFGGWLEAFDVSGSRILTFGFLVSVKVALPWRVESEHQIRGTITLQGRCSKPTSLEVALSPKPRTLNS